MGQVASLFTGKAVETKKETAQPVMSLQEAARQVQEMYEKAEMNVGESRARIVIMGPTGAGKSSVLNAAFGKNVARVGESGEPCTHEDQHFEPTDECPIHIYDTKGFEPLSDNKDIVTSLRKLNEERKKAARGPNADSPHKPDSPEHVRELLHAIWWVTDERLENTSFETVYNIFEKMPIFIIVNKCDRSKDEVDWILTMAKKKFPQATAVIPVVAEPKHGPMRKQCESCGSERIMCCHEPELFYTCRNEACAQHKVDQPVKRHYGIEDLMLKTVQSVPRLVAHAIYQAQQELAGDLDSMANKRITCHVLAAVALGASPTLSTAPLLLANQTKMFKALADVYGVKVSDSVAGQAACLGTALATGMKVIPGFGLLLGCATNAVIAGTVTATLGLAEKEILCRAARSGKLGEDLVNEGVQVLIEKELGCER